MSLINFGLEYGSYYTSEAELLNALQVAAVFGIHFNLVTSFNEKRNHNTSAGFNYGIFQGVCCCITFYARISFNHIKKHSWWNLCRKWSFIRIFKDDGYLLSCFHELSILDHLLVQINLGKIVVVHRSEERRVGKECRSRWSPYAYKEKKRR